MSSFHIFIVFSWLAELGSAAVRSSVSVLAADSAFLSPLANFARPCRTCTNTKERGKEEEEEDGGARGGEEETGES